MICNSVMMGGLCAIPSSATVAMVAVTQDELVLETGAAVGGLDLAGGTYVGTLSF